MGDFLSRIDPFRKFTFLVAIATVITFIHSFWVNVWVFGISMALLLVGTRPAQHVKALRILAPVTVFAVSLFFTGRHFGGGAAGPFGGVSTASTQSGINMAIRLYSFMGIGLLISLTTDPYALVKGLRLHAKLPRKFAYGMLAAIHLLPHMKTEYQNTRLAFMVRGVPVGPLSLKPVFSMLVNVFRWSEMLGIAMVSKGFHESEDG